MGRIYDESLTDSTLAFKASEPGTIRYQVDGTASYASAAAMDAASDSAEVTGTISAAAGNGTRDIDVSGLTSGLWYIHLVNNDGTPVSVSFTKIASNVVLVGVGSLQITGNRATIVYDRNALAQAAGLTLTSHPATVSVGANTVVAAGAASLVITAQGATITLDRNIASAVASLTLTSFAATITNPAGGDAYAVGGNSPELVVDFVGDYYRKGGADSTFAGVLSFSRSSDATRVNSSGNIETVTSGNARTGHHIYSGSAWVNEGMLLETEARTNLLLNSATLSTQDVTVTAVPHTLHFTGTGTITLSGASTAGPLVGTGTGENNRVSLTFTPSAGTLTCTVSGTVTNAQLEVGSTPSSYIPTSGATVTRAAETLTIPAANMTPSTTAVSMSLRALINPFTQTSNIDMVSWPAAGSPLDEISIQFDQVTSSFGQLEFWSEYNGAGQKTVLTATTYYALSAGSLVEVNAATRNTTSAMNMAVDGTALTANTSITGIPQVASADLGFGSGGIFFGVIKEFRLWEDVDLGDSGIEEAST